MPATSRSMLAIRMGCRFLESRSFHSVSALQAKPMLRKSPSVRAAERRSGPKIVVRTKKQYDLEESLPPMSLLRMSSSSGAMSITAETAQEFLRQYQEREATSLAGWEQKLCDDFGINPDTLVLLSRILNMCQSNSQRSLARRVMITASELGEASATLELVSSALRTQALNLAHYASTLQRLGILAKKGVNPQAMNLLGKVLLAQNKPHDALHWFRKATHSSVAFDAAGEAFVNLGRLLLANKDKEGAEAAFRKAALDLDDPDGYFYLSQLETGDKLKEYLLKAASSGVTEACHNLGSIELSEIGNRAQKPKSLRDFGMAREWFEVAADDGFGLSMLNLALMSKAGGFPEAGLHWLDKAQALPEVQAEAKRIRSQWNSQEIKLS